MMAPIGRGGKGRAFPPSPLANEDRELTSAASCLPPSPPSSPLPAAQVPGEPLQAAHDARAHEHIAWRALGRVTAAPGPPPEGGLGPRHTHPVRGHARSELYMHKHSHKHTLTLNGRMKPQSVFPSHTHAHTHFHTTADLTHIGDDILAPDEGWAPSKQEVYFLSAVVLEVEYVARGRHIFHPIAVILMCLSVAHVVFLDVVPHKYHLSPTLLRKSFEIFHGEVLCLYAGSVV